MDKTVFSCLVIIFMTEVSVTSCCNITDNDNCFYTVSCDIPAKINTVPGCDYTEPYITLVIRESPVQNATANFFNTKIDAYVRIITATGNRWDAIQNNAFSNFKNVLYMDLSQNEIKNIGKAFIGLGQLDSLNLSRNLLEVIKTEVFTFSENENRLFLLDLSYNLLTYLPEDIFVNIYNLRKLNIQGNKLTTLGYQFLTNLKNLNSLNLCCSNFTTFNITLKNFKSLRELDLSYNHIQGIDLSEIASLETINLSHNEIVEFKLDYLNQFPNLEELDLSFNKLKKIHGSTSIRKFKINTDMNEDRAFENTINNIGILDLSYYEIAEFKLRRNTQADDYRDDFIEQNNNR